MDQDYKKLEILVVDDGCTDSSIEIVENLSAVYQNGDKVRVFHMAANSGTYAARVSGMKEAKGKYILFLDSDDVFTNNSLTKTLVSGAKRASADIVHYKEIATVDNLTKEYDWANPQHFEVMRKPDALQWFMSTGRGTAFHGKMVKRELMLKVFETLGPEVIERRQQFCEDILVMVTAYMYADRYLGLNYTGYHYFFRWDSVSGAAHTNYTKAIKMAEDTIYAAHRLKKLIPERYHRQLANRFGGIVYTALKEIRGWDLDPICKRYAAAKIIPESKWKEISDEYCGLT